jgi:hypothetical protein
MTVKLHVLDIHFHNPNTKATNALTIQETQRRSPDTCETQRRAGVRSPLLAQITRRAPRTSTVSHH